MKIITICGSLKFKQEIYSVLENYKITDEQIKN